MIGLISRLSTRISTLSLRERAAIFLAVLAATAVVGAAVGYSQHGSLGVQVVAMAVAVSGGSALIALIVALRWHGTPNGIAGALGGSIIGIAPPLVTALVVQRQGGSLVTAGFFGWIITYYLIALTVKTLLIAPSSSAKPAKLMTPRTVSTDSAASPATTSEARA